MSVEVASRTESEISSRNEFQGIILYKCFTEGLIGKSDFKKINKIFKLVSDIIDNPEEEHESIRNSFKSGDYQFAADSLIELTIFKELLEDENTN